MRRSGKVGRGGLARIGVAIESDLLRRFDDWLERRGGGNRSEALRDLVRDRLTVDGIDDRAEVVGAVSIVYDHHHRALSRRLTSIQHDDGDAIVSALHVHLDHDRCLEVIVVRGPAARVRRIADRLIGEKGVVHGGLFLTRRLEGNGA
jgi:CopG family transcriptional regulator, nickel-responsive regulator